MTEPQAHTHTDHALTGQAILQHCLGESARYWPVQNGRVMHGDKPLSTWLNTQTTPAYLYNLNLISAQVAAVRAILPAAIHLHYAIKANPHPAIVQHLAALLDGFDCASLREMQLVECYAPAQLAHTSIAGPAKSDEALAFAIEHKLRINVESESELARIHRLAQARVQRARIALRINPPFELKGAGMKMGGGARPFGIDSEQIPALINQILAKTEYRNTLDLEGFHLYVGSQNREAAAINTALNASLELITILSRDTGFTPRHINFGGGFGVVYHPHDKTPQKALNLNDLCATLAAIANQAQAQWPGIHLNLELGRYLVAGAGMYLTRIVDRKISRGTTYLMCDGGMHHHLALSGNLGQVIRRNWPIIALDHLNEPQQNPVELAGPLCTPLDILGQNQPMPELAIGDYLGVLQSGAYGLTASPSQFLSQPDCPEWIIDDTGELPRLFKEPLIKSVVAETGF